MFNRHSVSDRIPREEATQGNEPDHVTYVVPKRASIGESASGYESQDDNNMNNLDEVNVSERQQFSNWGRQN